MPLACLRAWMPGELDCLVFWWHLPTPPQQTAVLSYRVERSRMKSEVSGKKEGGGGVGGKS